MKAIVATEYGSMEHLKDMDVEKPKPKDNEVLIKILGTIVTTADIELRTFSFPKWFWIPLRLYIGWTRPRVNIFGQELAGVVEAVGKNVTRFNTGDKVFGHTGARFGAHAEYQSVPENLLAIKPKNMNYVEAAAVPMGLDALHFIRKGNLKKGQKILINGAGGSIGTMAVQLAKLQGVEVTAVDSESKLKMLKSLGADYIIDYTKEDFTKKGKTYDVILDIIGLSHFSRSLRSLTVNGKYIIANPHFPQFIFGLLKSLTSRKKVITALASPVLEDLLYLKKLIESGKLRSVIDKTYTLEQIPDAHRYIENGHKKGNVAITIKHRK